MPKLDTWMQASIMLGKAMKGRAALTRFIPGMAVVLICIMVMSILIAALLLTLLYGFYQLALQQGWESMNALLAVCGAMSAIIALLGLSIRYIFRKLQPASLASQVTDIAEAFIRGMKTPSSKD